MNISLNHLADAILMNIFNTYELRIDGNKGIKALILLFGIMQKLNDNSYVLLMPIPAQREKKCTSFSVDILV